MIAARHQGWAELLFFPYVRGLLRRSFHRLCLLGEVPPLDRGRPLMIVPNHGTWWDGFFVYLLNRLLFGRKLHLMMLEEQLQRYGFFRRVGAFGIRPGLPRGVQEALRYSAEVLQDPDNALCLFPQGELRYHALRPLGFQRGLERILRLCGTSVQLLPLGIRCELLAAQRPEAFFLADCCYTAEAENFPGVRWLESEHVALLERLEAAVRGGQEGRLLLRGRTALDERWGRR
jgi:hypothetical protein